MENISIIGGGIAGLTLANFFEKINVNYSVYEASANLAPVGAGLALSANALQVMEILGLREQLESAGNRMKGLLITDENFKKISETNVERLEQKYKVGNLAIHRAALQKILADQIPKSKIVLNKRLSHISKEEHFTMNFENGTCVNSEIVFGADGIRSKVRNNIFGTVEPRNSGQVCWRAVLETDLADKYSNTAYEMWGKAKRFGFVRLSGKQIYWYALINKKDDKEPVDLKNIFKNFHPDVVRLIEESDEKSWIKNEICDLPKLSKWSENNLCLIGDAAHATTPNMGQGGCQAIEDAYVISKLWERNADCNKVFQEFEKIRRSKVNFVVENSWKIGKISQIRYGTQFRNAFFRMMPNSINEKILDRVLKLEI